MHIITQSCNLITVLGACKGVTGYAVTYKKNSMKCLKSQCIKYISTLNHTLWILYSVFGISILLWCIRNMYNKYFMTIHKICYYLHFSNTINLYHKNVYMKTYFTFCLKCRLFSLINQFYTIIMHTWYMS